MSLLRASRQAGRCASRCSSFARSFHASSASQYKVAVIGAAGGIGQPLSLLLKLHPKVTKLSLYDLAKVTPGVGVDLSHINTHSQVEAYTGDDMAKAVKDADIVVVPAGVPRKPGMSRDDLFNTNAGIVANIAKTCALNCPNANLLIISNPVNSTVPIVAEVLKRHGVYNKNKLFGVTTLDVCRANTFVAENQKLDVLKTSVPVVGGHAGITILPLLSQVPNTNFTAEEKAALTHRIMFGGDEVVKAKDGGGSATLSMAYAGSLFTDRVLRAMAGDSQHDIIECAYVESNLIPGVSYFASQVKLGKNGIEQILPLPKFDAFEAEKLEKALPELKDSIQKGIDFVNKMPK